MKEVLEGKLSAEQAATHIDRCLGCLACETHCPSGVKYGELISPFRAQHAASPEFGARLRRWMAKMTLPYPSRFRMAMRLGKLGRSLRPLVPKALRPMVDMVPNNLPPAESLPEQTPADGKPSQRVALLSGCAQQVLEPNINAATLRVLSRNGVETLIPRNQGCCGALAWHVGDAKNAEKSAIKNLQAFPDDVDFIVTNAAGCGSGLHDYPLILKDTPAENDARRFAQRVIDVSKLLSASPLKPIPRPARPLRIAYHDACHLAHAQQVRSEPRKLLAQIPDVRLVEIADADLCCGSAGTYNIDQPEIAEQLGRKKAQRIKDTGCDLVALGNIGCMVQIRKYLNEIDFQRPVLHTIQILDRAYAGELTAES